MRLLRVGVILLLGACTPRPTPASTGVTNKNHTWFPLADGVHAVGQVTAAGETISCESCHSPTAASFADFSCLGCHAHEQAVTDPLHRSVADYGYTSAACYSCHPVGAKEPFDHAGIESGCATCHQAGAAFAALPKAGFTHREIGATDCSACHNTHDWKDALAGGPAGLSHDATNDVSVTAYSPSFVGTSISRVTPQVQKLPSEMSHTTTSVAAAAFSTCANCHPNATQGAFFPGVFHSSLDALKLPQPATCNDCHVNAAPKGFVGAFATAPVRVPPSPEMRHEAVEWVNNAASTTPVLKADCATCHATPSVGADWSTTADAGTVRYHSALAAAQPASCLDCHANSRPTSVLTAPAAKLPAGVAFDHTADETLGDCASCHLGTTSWAGGAFHKTVTAPTSCATCHDGERPTSTTSWASATWQSKPFDAVTNSAAITHGASQDCAVCHSDVKTWVGGNFVHGPGTLSANACVSCHSTQRPDLALAPKLSPAQVTALLGFDHAINGRGECFACHQATAKANRYTSYFNASGTLPGGDWRDAGVYPGDVLAASVDEFINLNELKLNRSSTTMLVTGITVNPGIRYYNGMLHVSAQVPAALNAGPTDMPNNATCWHCHTNTAGTVTEYSGGKFHSALTSYSATFGGPVVPFAQPAKCNDCHQQMRPAGIVEKSDAGVATQSLQPMDHAATFVAPVMIAGASASGVADIDCAICHAAAGTTWGNGVFHSKIATAVPADCTSCHYPLMAEPAKSDLPNATGSLMAHRSSLLTFQRCDTCHSTALAKASTTPISATLFKPGQFHASLGTQPAQCLDCHSASDPAKTTASATQYTLTQGATASNQAQYVSHAAASIVGKDCAACHLADAKKSGAAWSTLTPLHSNAPGLTTCQGCHGLTNGLGSVSGTNNNLPAGLTDSTTLTTASATPTTGIPAGTHDQLTHTDLNVASRDCNACHTQVGPSKVAGVTGKEWSIAKLHASFTAQSPMVSNLTTARCSNCHLALKPGPAYTKQDHSTFTNVSGTKDCTPCHVYPGTGTSASPNWLGATGVPTYISVGGFMVPSPPAANTTTIAANIANLPHPAIGANTCTSCHAQASGGKGAIGYDHLSPLIKTSCSSCHEAGSDLIGTPWNKATTLAAGAGDDRAFTLGTIRVTYSGNSDNVANPNHFYPTDCAQCHASPAGNGLVTTGAAYTTAWKFDHAARCPTMTNPATCNYCHAGRHSKCD